MSRLERQSKVGTVGKLIVAGRLLFAGGVMAAPAVAIACGGDNSPSDTGQRTETLGTFPSQTGLIESPTSPQPQSFSL